MPRAVIKELDVEPLMFLLQGDRFRSGWHTTHHVA